MPDIIGPDPRASAVLLALCGKKVEVIPPKLLAADGDHFVRHLMGGSLLIHTEVEKRRVAECFANFLYEIRAYLRSYLQLY